MMRQKTKVALMAFFCGLNSGTLIDLIGNQKNPLITLIAFIALALTFIGLVGAYSDE